MLECAGRRIECLEEPVVHGCVRAGQRVQERRLADVRVAGERDGRSTAPDSLLPSRRPLALERLQSPLQERHARACQPTVGLELALAGPTRPDAATEPLEVLPHATHAGEVVLELRELDLELPLGAARVLREDVEDQLRAVDHACSQRILERALLGRAELVVGQQHLRRLVGVGLLQLRELPLPDEASRIRVRPMLHQLRNWAHARGVCQLAKLAELELAIRPFRVDPDEEPALRCRPWCGIGLARSHCEIMPRYAGAVTGLADRLAARTLELVDIPSESGSEKAIREHLLTLVPASWEAEYEGDEAFLFVGPRRPDAPLVVLAAHYDTVPAQGNLPGCIEDGAVHGLGASDMKGGLAVAIELTRDLEPGSPTCDLALLLFGREELPAEHNPLPALFTGSRAVHETTLAIVLEPTDLEIHAGCLGNVVARLTFHGTSGHAARPWLADSALEHAVRGLAPLFDRAPRVAVVEGLEFREVVSVTRLEAGIADNVIPGEATATLNLRYPPDREPLEAEEFLAELVPEGVSLDIVSNAPPARVVADTPAVRALRAAGGLELEPKQAWTNVADFTTRGLDAVNFGPGHTTYAHHPAERVAVDSLVTAYEVLHRFVTSPMGEDAA